MSSRRRHIHAAHPPRLASSHAYTKLVHSSMSTALLLEPSVSTAHVAVLLRCIARC